MSKVAITDTYLTNIANAIRTKSDSSDTYLPSEMASAILDIPTGGGTSGVYEVNSVEEMLEIENPAEGEFCITYDSSTNRVGLYQYKNSEWFTIIPMPNDLPPEYDHANYIEATGTQYIDTGCKPTSNPTNFSIEHRFMISPTANKSVDNCIVGGRTTTSMYDGIKMPNIYDHGMELQGLMDKYITSPSIVHGRIYKFHADLISGNSKVYLNDKLRASSTTTGKITTGYNLQLLAINNNGTVQWFCKGRLYYCKFWENGSLIRDFIPAVRKSDNIAGLYDLVNDQFYTNNGSGTFIYG